MESGEINIFPHEVAEVLVTPTVDVWVDPLIVADTYERMSKVDFIAAFERFDAQVPVRTPSRYQKRVGRFMSERANPTPFSW